MAYDTAVYENTITSFDINVQNIDEDALCRCTNDPHVTTFDQRYAYLYLLYNFIYITLSGNTYKFV